MSSGRQLALSLFSCLAGSAITLAAVGQAWAHGRAVQGELQAPLRVTGSTLAPSVSALAVAGLAGGLALLAVRGRVRAVLGALLSACGSAAAVVSARNARPGAASLGGQAGEALGTGSAAARNVTANGWPWVALAGSLLLVVGGGLAARRGALWPGMSARYSRRAEAGPSPVPAAPAPEDPALEQWRAMDRGEDPTVRPPSEA